MNVRAEELRVGPVLRACGRPHPLLVLAARDRSSVPANSGTIPRWMNVVRAVSTEGHGRTPYYAKVRSLLERDRSVRGYFEGTSTVLPDFYEQPIRQDLGPFWEYLPPGALSHDHNAYLHAADGADIPSPIGSVRAGVPAA